jgi:Holliday junction resolvase
VFFVGSLKTGKRQKFRVQEGRILSLNTFVKDSYAMEFLAARVSQHLHRYLHCLSKAF